MSITIYEHGDFGGRSQVLSEGRYDINELTIGDNALSSLRVPEGYRVTLYQHSFEGPSVSYTGDTSWVGDFNDETSSIVVERLETVLSLANGQYATLPGVQAQLYDRSFTAEAWIKLDVISGDQCLFGADASATRQGLHLTIRSGRIYMGFYGVDTQGATTLAVDRWYHLAYVYDAAAQTQRVYVDGVEDGVGTGKVSYLGTGQILLGRSHSQYYLRGDMSEARIWDHARSATEILANKDRRLVGTEAGLVALFPLDEGVGSTLTDRVAGRNGTLVAGTWTTGGSLALHASASAPKRVLSLASGQYARLPGVQAMLFDSSFTVEAWVKLDAGGGDQTILGTAATTSREGLHLIVRGGKPYMGFYTVDTVGVTTLLANTWTHLAWTYDHSTQTQRVYVNGVEDGAESGRPSWIGTTEVQLGFWAGQHYMRGDVSELRIWDYVRGASAIEANMGKRLTGAEPGLSALYPLDEGAGSSLTERVAGRSGVVVAGTWETDTSLPVGGVFSWGGSPIGGGGSGTGSAGTPTDSPTETIELPQAVADLGTLDVSVLFVPFDLPIQFLGTITVQPLSQAISYSGSARLVQPFTVDVDPLELNIFAADDDNGGGPGWTVKFGLPQSTSLETVIRDEVIDAIPGSIAPLVEALVMPYIALYSESTIILASEDGADAELGNYFGGFNAYATVQADQVTPFNLLHAAFPQLGLDTRDVVLGVGAAKGGAGDFFVGCSLQLDAEIGTPLIVFNSIGLNVHNATADTSVGAELEFTLNLAGELLRLRGGLEVSAGVGQSVTVWGALDAADGVWRDPLGIRGLSISGLGVEVGATPAFPWVILGLRGEAHIGGDLLGGRIGIYIDPSDWSKAILDIYSEEGISVPRLVDGLTGGWLDLSSILDVSLTNLQLYIAPKGGTIAGQNYDPGLAISGELDLWGWRASVDGELDFDSGGHLQGTMDRVDLSAGGATFLKISNNADDAGPSIDVAFETTNMGGTIDGSIIILGGLYTSSFQASLNAQGFTATIASDGMGIYQNASLSMTQGGFKFMFGPTIGVSVDILGRSIGLSVGTSVTTRIDESSFSQGIGFSFSAMGVGYSPGPFMINVPFSELADLAEAFYEHAADLIVGGLLGSLAEAGEAAFNWVKTNVTASAEAASKFFQDVGADAEAIAVGAVNYMGATASDAVGYLNLGANEAAGVLKDGFGWTADQTGRWLHDVGGFGDTAVNGALNGAGYAADEVADFMGDVFGGSWIPHVDIPYVDIIPHIDHFDLGGY